MSSFPEFFDRKILRESRNIRMLWIALEFVLHQIRAMTDFNNRFNDLFLDRIIVAVILFRPIRT
jgi:predicted nucleic acid-binding protein